MFRAMVRVADGLVSGDLNDQDADERQQKEKHAHGHEIRPFGHFTRPTWVGCAARY